MPNPSFPLSLDRKIIEAQLGKTFESIDLPFLGDKIEGKVRDCYVCGDRRVLITSDRLSAFDVVLTTIPFKGQVLNDMADYWFKQTQNIVENHIIERPHPNVFIAKQVDVLPVEVVVRGYLAGSAWRDYEAGRLVSGIKFPAGMQKSERFSTPIITPSTKADFGEHDEPISSEEVVQTGLVAPDIWEQVRKCALELFACGTQLASQRGLILVDTKYEFGLLHERGSSRPKIILADEIHTSDSSRYWIAETYLDAYEAGQDPVMLDKEFVRRELLSKGYAGEGDPPFINDAFRVDTAERYIEACERITGVPFKPIPGDPSDAIREQLKLSFCN